ncbi:Na+/H+ antiporter subunit E [Pelagibacterium lentulum]|uniref:Uncharacterized protein n=1 Tax=Pelagibacterium lentulum TaxID=2029865 RepID=A0A916RLK6_9HYPH|nr:Na+/H+ antiporter subunit E [Pelagibacterium lentulum]GGA61881.1 hypothetical protein GCM10011499_35240 [Pelagibacterium lentulum]
MVKVIIILKRTVVFSVLWVVLAGADKSALIAGVPTVLAAVLLSLTLLPAQRHSAKLLHLLAMLPGFLWRSLLGGVDVAWRAFSPRLPISPGWVEFETELPMGGARSALGGEFSLMPGTLVAGSRGNALLIHCLDASEDTRHFVKTEEQRLCRALGIKPKVTIA